MAGLDLEEMRRMQQELHRKYHEKFGEGWKELSPDIGREKLLWMFVEAGEVADIMKNRVTGRLWRIQKSDVISRKRCATC